MTHKLTKAIAAASLLAPLAIASAQDDTGSGASKGPRGGDSLMQVGLFHVDTLDQSRELRTALQPGLAALGGVQSNFVSEGTGAKVSKSDTLAVIYSYFLTDHWALKFEGGIPAEFKLYGEGVVRPTGPLGNLINVDLGAPENNPLAKVRQWSPVMMVNYYFRDAEDKVRPYAGLGFTYTWFDNIRLDKDFENKLNQQFGATLALANLQSGPTSVSAKAKSDIAPVFNLGVTADIAEHWSLSGSVSFVPLQTKAKIMINSAEGDRLATSTTKLDLNPLVLAVLVGYRFDLF